ALPEDKGWPTAGAASHPSSPSKAIAVAARGPRGKVDRRTINEWRGRNVMAIRWPVDEGVSRNCCCGGGKCNRGRVRLHAHEVTRVRRRAGGRRQYGNCRDSQNELFHLNFLSRSECVRLARVRRRQRRLCAQCHTR